MERPAKRHHPFDRKTSGLPDLRTEAMTDRRHQSTEWHTTCRDWLPALPEPGKGTLMVRPRSPMRMLSRCLLSLALPGALVAASTPTMTPTPARAPAVTGPDTQLVDRVIPAYGMYLQRGVGIDAAAAALAQESLRFAADVEAKVMAGELRRGAATFGIATDARGLPIRGAQPQITARAPLSEERTLLALFDATVKMRERLTPSGISAPIAEHQHIDASLSALTRAAELLRFGLGDDIYTDLDARSVAWKQRIYAARLQVRETRIAEVMAADRRISRSRAEQTVNAQPLIIPEIDLLDIPQDVRDAVEVTITADEPTPAKPPATRRTPTVQPAPTAPAIPEPSPSVNDLPVFEEPVFEEPAAPEPVEALPELWVEPQPAAPAPEPEPEPAMPEWEPVVEPEPVPALPEPEPVVPEAEPMADPEAPAAEEPEAPAAEEPEPEAAPEPAMEAVPAPAPAPVLDLDDLPDL